MTSTGTDLSHLVGPAIAATLAAKGYDTLTPVQEAVLDEALNGRDLRITSQTGSGKTIAVGLVVRDVLDDLTVEFGGPARPRVLVLTPTRELAKQVAEELGWLFAGLRVRVSAVTGGSSYVDQRRALSSNPAVVVATPGRLRDSLERGKIDAKSLAAVVLDEADQMLDLGFREDLEAILACLPEERRTHLVSATFSRDVVALADKCQKDPVHVQGTRLGEANLDIEHVVHLVVPDQRIDALINLMLEDPDARSLVFARTRADVSRIAGELAEAGFVVRSLSGEMDQPERERALAAFRSGGVQALVATDVAARGIDVAGIARVIQVEPPTNVETYTHRSGRTGRAGKQGMSLLFVSPQHYQGIARGLARGKIAHKVEPLPGKDAIYRAREARMLEWLARGGDGTTLDTHTLAIAERVVKGEGAVEAVARLLEKAGLHGPTHVREVRNITPMSPRDERPMRGTRDVRETRDAREPREPREGRQEKPANQEFVPFHVSWGGKHGADTRRLLGMVCRRGGIEGRSVGAIKVDAIFSIVEVARDVADAFEASASKPDPRDPKVRIRRWSETTDRERERPVRLAQGAVREAREAHVERPAPGERQEYVPRGMRAPQTQPPPAPSEHVERVEASAPAANVERPARREAPAYERPARRAAAPERADRPARAATYGDRAERPTRREPPVRDAATTPTRTGGAAPPKRKIVKEN
jgi:ATP-dependent RNA helicase DeaD